MTEKYVCSLEHAKKLKELGVKQDGKHYHVRYGDLEGWKSRVATKFEIAILQNNYEVKIIAFAPCVGELGEMLPQKIRKNGIDYWLEQCKRIDWHISYVSEEDKSFLPISQEYIEANARASAVEYLVENKLMKV